ncbi:MAG: hypothetical protein HOC91_15630 [Nitrospinaceae bacterium]|jgi:DNA-binding protein HU-beta|nr:hypothetical protein [Nitrospinaceae bacterium]MBT3433908.1 hypothetical protein [Nitrospinaceae bacterium]MBT4093074.1 hypothetical protein [Nitrospinaceae bacterium]MBT4431939.1 hypothetical protein [Nitrospinaceae bacterium]MBT5368123.1 hypothetical protein [Nitrospinaceae bacterium]
MKRTILTIFAVLMSVSLFLAAGAQAAKENFDRSKPHIIVGGLNISTGQVVNQIAVAANLSKADAKRALEAFISNVSKMLIADGRVVIGGFGTFFVFNDKKTREVRFKSDSEIMGDIEDFWRETNEVVAFDIDSDDDGLDLTSSDPRVVERNFKVIRSMLNGRVKEYLGHVTLLYSWFDNGAAGAHAKRMNKAELIEGIASNANLSKADAKRALDGFVNATSGALKKGDRISLVGFGSFSISKRAARTGRNPQTGKEIQIAAKNVVRFKAGSELSGKVN